jgi:HAD superfamily phosphoserine phosphatase-like hydrolase
MVRPMAIYDLDRTVTFRPTYTLFLLGSAWRLTPLRLPLAPLLALLWIGNKLKFYTRDRLKSLMWGLMLGPVEPARLERVAADFARRMLDRNIRPGARMQIARDHADGAMLVLATAAHELYAARIARELGFDAVVATRMLPREDGRIGPALDGANVYGQGKLAALIRFGESADAADAGAPTIFYSDSSSDLPVFDWADRAVAVNPSRRLARMAASRGWPVVDWGRP